MNSLEDDPKPTGQIGESLRFNILMVCLIPTAAIMAAAFLDSHDLDVPGASAGHLLSKNHKRIRAAREVRIALKQVHNGRLKKTVRDGMPIPPSPF